MQAENQVVITTNTSEFASAVWNELMQPDQRTRLADLLVARNKWKKSQNWTEGISQTFFIFASILAFAAFFWELKILSFLSGTIGATGTGLFAFSKYSGSESSERSINLARTWLEIRQGPPTTGLENSIIQEPNDSENPDNLIDVEN